MAKLGVDQLISPGCIPAIEHRSVIRVPITPVYGTSIDNDHRMTTD